MEFIETPVFSKGARSLLGEEELRRLQMFLLLYPATGAVIPGSGGLRKLRWVSSGKGKRGGLRIIYYWITEDHRIFLLHIYKKSQQEDLTSEQLKRLKSIVQEE
jgi:mRNA-degrading endonuclease RelE of RelBE toxin-antitoxin system